MNVSGTALAVTGIGALLILASFAWVWFVTPDTVWSEDQAEQLNRAVADLVGAAHANEHAHDLNPAHDDEHDNQTNDPEHEHGEHGHDQDAKPTQDIRKFQQKWREQQHALDAARHRAEGIPKTMRWIGAAMAAIGGAVFLSTQKK